MSIFFENDDFVLIDGTGKTVLSAPHGYIHQRDGEIKDRDAATDALVKTINQETNAPIIYIKRKINFDPNYDKECLYKNVLRDYIEKSKKEFLLDIHGMKDRKICDIDLGTSYYKNVNNDSQFVDSVRSILRRLAKNTEMDRLFPATNPNTVSKYINQTTGIKTIQMEIAHKYRLKDPVGIDRNRLFLDNLKKTIGFLNSQDNITPTDIQNYREDIYFYNLKFMEFGFEINIETPVTSLVETNHLVVKILNEVLNQDEFELKRDLAAADYNYKIYLPSESSDSLIKVKKILGIFEKIYNDLEIYQHINHLRFACTKKVDLENTLQVDSMDFYKSK